LTVTIMRRELAQGLEEAEARHLAGQIGALAALDPALTATTLTVEGGVAALTVPGFGRKLNHVVGLGMRGAVDHPDVERLETAFFARDIPIEIDLCPYADPSALTVLAARGYRGTAFSNTYCCSLAPHRAAGPCEAMDTRLRCAPATDIDAFIQASVDGFAAQPNPRPRRLLEVLARSAAMRRDVLLFTAETDGGIAGTAALALLQTACGTVAHLFLASTRHGFRGKGVQRALLDLRLDTARQRGADFASVTARPLNASARNTERAGFRLAYTKSSFSKAPPARV
jgi:GNAT superfamily N-acetyltransferase